MKNFKNSFLIIITLVCLVGSFAATTPEQHKFKNLKVLPKNISEEALDKIMDEYKIALGVKCNYCHAKSDTSRHLDFASDAKPEKETARKMMRMTAEINKKYFNFNKVKIAPQVVTCITCHRGNAKPENDSTLARN